MKPPKVKIETLVVAIYALCFPAAFLIGDALGKAGRFGNKSQTILPMFIGS